VTRVVAAVDPAIAQVPQAHYLFVDVLAVWGTAQRRARLLRDVLAGARIGNALAERGGTHAQDLRTRIDADGVLNGIKYYCTGALTSRWIAVSALDHGDRLVAAFVARDAPGVTVGTDWDVIGRRATISGTTRFEDVAVDPSLLVDYARAYEVPQQLGARAQLTHAAIEVGIAGGALRDATTYLQEKARPSTEAVNAVDATAAYDDPHVLHRYGRAATRVRAAERPGTTSTATGATRAPTRSTTRRTGSTTTSPPTRWPASSRPTTGSCSDARAGRAQPRSTITLVALITAVAAMPGRRPRSSTASRDISDTMRNGPHARSTCAMTPSCCTATTTPAIRLRALVCSWEERSRSRRARSSARR
jgi:alkylation response protein AidB-like acyl-CoA dehydrogenase